MSILVTGGSRLVGGSYPQEQLHVGHAVDVLDRMPLQQSARALHPTRFVRPDAPRLGYLPRGLEGQEAIIHLAAILYPLHDPPLGFILASHELSPRSSPTGQEHPLKSRGIPTG